MTVITRWQAFSIPAHWGPQVVVCTALSQFPENDYCTKRFNLLSFIPFTHVSHEKPTNQAETSISGLKVYMTWKIIAVCGCHLVSFVMNVSVPSLKNTASIFPFWLQISCKYGDLSNLSDLTLLICMLQKTFQKGNRHSSVFWRAFQMLRNYFHVIHFKRPHALPFLSNVIEWVFA